MGTMWRRAVFSAFAAVLAFCLQGVSTAHADDGDATLRAWLEASDLVVDATIQEMNGPIRYEIGVAHYVPTLEVHAQLKGRRAASSDAFRAEIVRFEADEADRLPYLEVGSRVVLFLKQAPKGNVPRYQTVDLWFGVQPYGPWLSRRLAALGLAKPTEPPEPTEPTAPATVKALRYRIVYGESAIDLTHGGGQWVHEIYFPEDHVAAMLVHDDEIVDAPAGTPITVRPRARLFAYHADGPRNDLTGFGDAPPSAVEEIEVPEDLARAIIALAARGDEQQAEQARLGEATAQRLGLKAIADRPQ